MKSGTRVRHIVTRTEGKVIDTYTRGRYRGRYAKDYVHVILPNRLTREWRIEAVEEVRK